MNDVTLQVITVALDNGERGVFIGGPLVTRDGIAPAQRVEAIQFSDIQKVRGDVTIEQVLALFAEQAARSRTSLQ